TPLGVSESCELRLRHANYKSSQRQEKLHIIKSKKERKKDKTKNEKVAVAKISTHILRKGKK
ncbi:MAG: hypothetical protein IJQ77_08775, partial [Synergistaceae bacterium]|nr:hypothetical protein [Synergistaceae bacterium]